VIIDPQPLYRAAIRHRLQELCAGAQIIEADALRSAAIRGRPALVLVDLGLSDAQWAAQVAPLRQRFPDAVLAMSSTMSPAGIRAVVRAGANAFLPKTMPLAAFTALLPVLVTGGSYLPVEALQIEAGQVCGNGARPEFEFVESLTGRERQLLAMLATGATNKEIALRLDLAEVTVKLLVRRILKLLGARNRSEAAAIAVRAGL
jgi:two-component system nitrate/nitrite response regulator NarL